MLDTTAVLKIAAQLMVDEPQMTKELKKGMEKVKKKANTDEGIQIDAVLNDKGIQKQLSEIEKISKSDKFKGANFNKYLFELMGLLQSGSVSADNLNASLGNMMDTANKMRELTKITQNNNLFSFLDIREQNKVFADYDKFYDTIKKKKDDISKRVDKKKEIDYHTSNELISKYSKNENFKSYTPSIDEEKIDASLGYNSKDKKQVNSYTTVSNYKKLLSIIEYMGVQEKEIDNSSANELDKLHQKLQLSKDRLEVAKKIVNIEQVLSKRGLEVTVDSSEMAKEMQDAMGYAMGALDKYKGALIKEMMSVEEKGLGDKIEKMVNKSKEKMDKEFEEAERKRAVRNEKRKRNNGKGATDGVGSSDESGNGTVDNNSNNNNNNNNNSNNSTSAVIDSNKVSESTKELDAYRESLKYLKQDYNGLVKYAVSAQEAFEKVNELVEKAKNGKLTASEAKDLIGFNSRYDSLSAGSKDMPLFDDDTYEIIDKYDEKYQDLSDRVSEMSEDQKSEIETILNEEIKVKTVNELAEAYRNLGKAKEEAYSVDNSSNNNSLEEKPSSTKNDSNISDKTITNVDTEDGLGAKDVARLVASLDDEFAKVTANFGSDLAVAVEDFKGELNSISQMDFNNVLSSLRQVFTSIVEQFKKSLDNVSLGGSNDLYKLLQQWSEASKILVSNGKLDNERASLASQSTGKISNSYLYDKEGEFSKKMLQDLTKLEGGVTGEISSVYDTWIHSHPFEKVKKGLKAIGSDVGFSADDLNIYINEYLKKGIKNMMVASNGKYTNIDFSDLTEDQLKKVYSKFSKDEVFTTNQASVVKGGIYNFDEKTKLLNSAFIKAMTDIGIENASSRVKTGNIDELNIDASALTKNEEKAAKEAQDLLKVLTDISNVLVDIKNSGSFKFEGVEELIDNIKEISNALTNIPQPKIEEQAIDTDEVVKKSDNKVLIDVDIAEADANLDKIIEKINLIPDVKKVEIDIPNYDDMPLQSNVSDENSEVQELIEEYKRLIAIQNEYYKETQNLSSSAIYSPESIRETQETYAELKQAMKEIQELQKDPVGNKKQIQELQGYIAILDKKFKTFATYNDSKQMDTLKFLRVKEEDSNLYFSHNNEAHVPTQDEIYELYKKIKESAAPANVDTVLNNLANDVENGKVDPFEHISETLTVVKTKGKETFDSINVELMKSESYVKNLQERLTAIVTNNNGKIYQSKDKQDGKYALKNNPELEPFKNAKEMPSEEDWNSYLSTLPRAKEYLKSIDYKESVKIPIDIDTSSIDEHIKALREKYSNTPIEISIIPDTSEANKFIANAKGQLDGVNIDVEIGLTPKIDVNSFINNIEKAIGKRKIRIQTENDFVDNDAFDSLVRNIGLKDENVISELRSEINGLILDSESSSGKENILDIIAKDSNVAKDSLDGLNDEYKRVKDYLSANKMKITDNVKTEFKDNWKNVRATIGVNTVRNNVGVEPTNYLDELNSVAGTHFDVSGSEQDAVSQLYEYLKAATSNQDKLRLNAIESSGILETALNQIDTIVEKSKNAQKVVREIVNITPTTKIIDGDEQKKEIENYKNLEEELKNVIRLKQQAVEAKTSGSWTDELDSDYNFKDGLGKVGLENVGDWSNPDSLYKSFDSFIGKFKTVEDASKALGEAMSKNIKYGTKEFDDICNKFTSPISQVDTSNTISAEKEKITELEKKVNDATSAVKLKNDEFKNEGEIVETTVEKEKIALVSLEDKIKDIISSVSNLSKELGDTNVIDVGNIDTEKLRGVLSSIIDEETLNTLSGKLKESLEVLTNGNIISEWKSQFLSAIEQVCSAIDSSFNSMSKNRLYNSLNEITEADVLMRSRRSGVDYGDGTDTTNEKNAYGELERGLLYNSKTKEVSNTHVVDQKESVSDAMFEGIRELKTSADALNKYDTELHTHPVDLGIGHDLAFSPEDLVHASVAYNNGITKQSILSNGEIKTLDFGGIVDDMTSAGMNTDEINKALEGFINEYSKEFKNLKENFSDNWKSSIVNGQNYDLSTIDTDKIFESAFKNNIGANASQYLSRNSIEDFKVDVGDIKNENADVNILVETLQKLSEAISTLNAKEFNLDLSGLDKLSNKIDEVVVQLKSLGETANKEFDNVNNVNMHQDNNGSSVNESDDVKNNEREILTEIEPISEEWDRASEAAKRYSSEIGNILKIEKVIRQDKDGNNLMSYKVSGDVGYKTFGASGNTVGSKNTWADNAKYEKSLKTYYGYRSSELKGNATNVQKDDSYQAYAIIEKYLKDIEELKNNGIITEMQYNEVLDRKVAYEKDLLDLESKINSEKNAKNNKDVENYEKSLKKYYDYKNKEAKGNVSEVEKANAKDAYDFILSYQNKINDLKKAGTISDEEANKVIERQRQYEADLAKTVKQVADAKAEVARKEKRDAERRAKENNGRNVSELENAYKGLANSELKYQELMFKNESGSISEKEQIKLEQLINSRRKYNDVIEESERRISVLSKEEMSAIDNQKQSLKEGKKLYNTMFKNASANRVVNVDEAYAQANNSNKIVEHTNGRISKIGDTLPSGMENDIIGARVEIEQLNKEFLNGDKTLRQYSNGVNKVASSLTGIIKIFDASALSEEKAKEELKKYFKTLTGDKKIEPSFTTSKDGNKITSKVTYKDSENNIHKLGAAIDMTSGKMTKLATNTTKSVGGIGKMFDWWKGKMLNVAGYITSFVGIYDVWNAFREGVTVIKDLDDSLTEMRKVSNESLADLKQYQSESFALADSVGTDAKTIQDSSASWMRLGENLDEAKKSAKYANELLKVSEFESIDDATNSLVAMSQAYKDLDKIDIIDKLNNIGNNFSISTDGIATALQDSASSLTTAGNNIDESIALITAGNAVTQDPEKVGAGMRTIALRLTGTKAASTELQEMGEETDGLITTQSKLRETIKTATAVASNGRQGIDIFDDNGNYKDTYETLQDIADIYEEILADDKKTGDNKHNLLLETIAGKNRSNIAASILQNPDMLKDVYNSSQNSEGSADEELKKQLDSITSKITKFKNQLQKLAFDSVSSDAIKNVITFGTKAISTFDKLIAKFGLGKTTLMGIISVVSAFKFAKTDLGKLIGGKIKTTMIPNSYDSYKKGGNSIGKALNVKSSKQTAKGIENLSNVDVDMFDLYGNTTKNKFANNDKVKELATAIDGLNEKNARAALSTKGLSEAQQEQVLVEAGLIDSTGKVKTTSDLLEATNIKSAVSEVALTDAKEQKILTQIEEARMSGTLNKAKFEEILTNNGCTASEIASASAKVFGTGATTGLTAAIWANIKAMVAWMLTNPVGWIMLAGVAIAGITKAVDTFTVSEEEAAKKQQELIDKGNEAKQSINDSQKSYNDASSAIDKYSKKYAELSQGVNQATGANISLSDSDYNDFLDTSNELAKIFPELTKGYDDNGNALLNLSGNIDSVNKGLKEQLDREKELAHSDIVKKLPTYYKGQQAKIDKEIESKSESKDDKKEQDTLYNYTQTGTYIASLNQGKTATYENYKMQDGGAQQKALEKIAKNSGFSLNDVKSTQEGGGNGEIYVSYKFTDAQKKAIKDYYKNYEEDYKKEQKASSDRIKKYNEEMSTTLFDSYSNDASFTSMSENLQNAVYKMTQNIDWSSKEMKNKSYDESVQYIRDNYIDAINNIDDESLKSDLANAFTLNESDFDGAQGYLDYIDSLKKKLKEANVEIPISFGEEDIKKTVDDLDKNLNDLSLGEKNGLKKDGIDDGTKSYLEDYLKDNGITSTEDIQHWIDVTSGAENATKAIELYNEAVRNGEFSTSKQRKSIDKYNEELVNQTNIINDMFSSNKTSKKGVSSNITSYLEKEFGIDKNSSDYAKLHEELYNSIFNYSDGTDGTILKDDIANNLSNVLENAYSVVSKYSNIDTPSTFVQFFKDAQEQADALGISVGKLQANLEAEDVAKQVDELWNSDNFKDANKDLTNLAKISGVATSDITELANSNADLNELMSDTGLTADMLASAFTDMGANGTSAVDVITGDIITLNDTLKETSSYLTAADTKYSDWKKKVDEGDDYNDQYTEFQEAYAQLGEYIKKDEYGKDFKRTASLLFGDDITSIDSIKEAYKKTKKYYAEMETEGEGKDTKVKSYGGDNGYVFLKELSKKKDLLNSLGDTVNVNSDGSFDFEIDPEHYATIAKEFDMTTESVTGLVEALGMFGNFHDYNIDELTSKVKELDGAVQGAKGNTFVSKQKLNNDLQAEGLESFQIDEANKNLSKQKGMHIVDFEDNKNINSTVKSISKGSKGMGNDQGLDVNKKNIDLSSYIDTMSKFGMNAEEMEQYIVRLTNANYKFTDAQGTVYDTTEEVNTALEDATKYDTTNVMSQSFAKLKQTAQSARNELSKTDDTVKNMKLNLDTEDLDEAKTSLTTFGDYYNKFIVKEGKEKGKVDLNVDGAEKAQAIMRYLIKQKQSLEHPAVMNIDVSKIKTEKVQNEVQQIQNYFDTINDLEIKVKTGEVTEKEAQDTLTKAQQELDGNQLAIDANIDITSTATSDGLSTIQNSITSSSQDALIKLGVDASAFTDYQPEDKTANVIYNVDKTAVNEFKKSKESDIHNAKVYYSYKYKNDGSKPKEVKSGGHDVNGTNYANGTAHALGTTPKEEVALTGELGEELMVNPKTGRWTTLGENGAEFANIPKGAIIFNHKQTKELLSKGHIKSRGKSNDNGDSITSKIAFANGTAYPGGKNTNNHNVVNDDNNDDSTKTKKKKTSDDDKNKKKSKTSFETFQEWVAKLFDWIEVKLDRLQTKMDKSITRAEDAMSYISDNATTISDKMRNSKVSTARSNYKSAIKTNEQLISANKKGASKYSSTAETVFAKGMNALNNKKDGYFTNSKGKKAKLSNAELNKKMNNIKDKVADGSIDISKYGSDFQEVINDYKNYYDKAKECSDAVYDLTKSQDEYKKALYNLPMDLATSKIDKLSSALNILSAKAEAIAGGSKVYDKVTVSDAKDEKNQAIKAEKKAKNKVTSTNKNLSTDSKALKKSVKNTKNSKSITKAIKDGKEVDTKGLKGSALKNAKEYNNSLKKSKEAKSNYNTSKAYTKTATANYNDVKKIASANDNQPYYMEENSLLDLQTDNEKEQNKANQQALKDATKEVSKQKANQSSKSKKVSSTKNTLAKKEKALTGKAKSSQKDGKAISTKGLKGKELKEAKAYNKALKANQNALKANKKATKELKYATDAQKTASDNAAQSQADYTQTLQDNAQAKLDNVNSYYDTQGSVIDSEISKSESAMNYNATKNGRKNASDYNSIIASQSAKVSNAETSRNKYIEELAKQSGLTVDQATTAINNNDVGAFGNSNLSEEQIKNAIAQANNLDAAWNDARTQYEQYIDEQKQVNIDNLQSDIDTLIAQMGNKNAKDKLEDYNALINKTNESYKEQIDLERDSVKKAKLQAEQQKAISDIVKEQLDTVKSISDNYISMADAISSYNTAKEGLKEATGKDSYATKTKDLKQQAQTKQDESNMLLGGADVQGSAANFKAQLDAKAGSLSTDDYNKELETYYGMLQQGYADATEAAKASYEAWYTSYMQPMIDGYEDLQTAQNKLNDAIELKTTWGASETVEDYESLISSSKEAQENLEKQNKILEEQQKNYDVGSDKYRELQKQIDDNNSSITDCKKNQIEWNKAIEQLPIDKLKEELEILDAIADKNKSISDLRSEIGIDLTKADYDTQRKDLDDQIANLTETRQENMALLDKAVAEGRDADAKDLEKAIAQANNDIIGLMTSKAQLDKAYRDDVLWRYFERAHDEAQRFADTLSGIGDLMSDNFLNSDKTGFTDEGIAKAALMVEQYETAREEVQNYSKDIANLNELNKQGLYAPEEYKAKFAELSKSLLDAGQNVKSYMKSIVDMYKQVGQNELDLLFKEMDARAKALQKKKEFYDYDKTIKGKTKDVKALEAQINALKGVEFRPTYFNCWDTLRDI